MKPTKEGLKSATYHPLNIIGRLPKAKIELGSVEILIDIQVVKQDNPIMLVGNDLCFDRVTNHDGRFITIRCQPGGAAREIIPITYGHQLVYVSVNDDVRLRPRDTHIPVQATLTSSLAGRSEKDYLDSFRQKDVHIENIRYGPTDSLDNYIEPIQIDELIQTVTPELEVTVLVNNPDYQFRTLEKGTLIALVTKVRMGKTDKGSIYFTHVEVPGEPRDSYPDRSAGSDPSSFLVQTQEEGYDGTGEDSGYETTGEDQEILFPNVMGHSFLMPSHDEDLEHILQGSPEGNIPLPSGYELADVPNPFEEYDISDIKTPYLTPEQREQVLAVCRKYPKAFAAHTGDIGRCTYGEFDMEIGDKILKPEPYRPCPVAYLDEVDAILDGMARMGVIELSDSPYATNLVVARRPNSTKLRLCLDSRGVNLHLQNVTAWPIPPQEESLERLATAEISSSLDIHKAFWGIKLSARSRPLTAFYHRQKLWAFATSPYGIKSLPGYFNRLMSHMTRGMTNFSSYFFDDVILFSGSFDQHLIHLDQMLARVTESGFRLQPSKCQIGVPKTEPLRWLGNIVVNNHLCIDPIKIRAVEDLPVPQSGKELLRGLSLVSWLRKFLPHLATVVAPLNDLVNASFRKKNPEFEWLPIHEERFNLMKKMVTHAPALRLIDVNSPLTVYSDASKVGCGGVLAMSHDAGDGNGPQEYVCGYVSRRFNAAERRRMSCPERELVGVLYATASWSKYLLGRPFTLVTDAQCLLYVHVFGHSTPRLMKASLHLQELDFKIKHMSAHDGNAMQVCDYLSRAYADTPDITLSWQNLRSEVFDQIRVPPNWPKEAISKEVFATYADEYFRTFCPQFPDGTKEIERMKITYFYRDVGDPVAKQRILDKERELKQEYYRYARANQPTCTSSAISPPTSQTESQFTHTNEAEPPSSARSPPPSESSPPTSYFSDLGEGEKETNISQSDSESYCDYLSASESEVKPTGANRLDDGPEKSEIGLNANSRDSPKESNLMMVDSEARPDDPGLSNVQVYSNRFCKVKFGAPPQACKLAFLLQNELGEDNGNTPLNAAQVPGRGIPGVGELTASQMSALQMADPEILRLINRFNRMSPGDKEKTPLLMHEGVLCRRMKIKNIRHIAIALPKVLRLDVLRMAHGDGFGTEHRGSEKTQERVHEEFFWPRMGDDIKSFVSGCVNCSLNSPTTKRQVDFQRRMTAQPSTPNSAISVDLVINLETSAEGYRHIAVFVCNFSRFVVLAPLRTKKPEECCRAFLTRYISVLSVPLSLHSDAGSEVDATFMQRFCKMLSVRKSRTPSWSPNSNSICETMNRSIGSLLRTATFPGHLRKQWPALLPWIALSLNESISTVHGLRPREIMFGATPSFLRLPLVSWDSPVVGQDSFLKATRAGQQFAWDVVRAQQMRVHSDRDKPRRRHEFAVGDFVVVKNHVIGAPGTNKLKRKYLGPFRVIQAYAVSLVVQKWMGANDPLVTQGLLHHHKMDAKHLECRIVNARDCKKYPSMDQVEKGPGVSPDIIRMFLKSLGHKKLLKHTPESEGPYEWDVNPDALEVSEEDGDSENAQEGARQQPPDRPAQPQAPRRDPPVAPADAESDPNEPSQSPVQHPASPDAAAGSPAAAGPAPLDRVSPADPSAGTVSPPLGADPNPGSAPASSAHASPPAELLPPPAQPSPTDSRETSEQQEPGPPGVNPPTSPIVRGQSTPDLASPDMQPAIRRQPSRATKSAWQQMKWPQVLHDLKPRSRRASAPTQPHDPGPMTTDELLTQEMNKSKGKNVAGSARGIAKSGRPAEQAMSSQRVASWVTMEPEKTPTLILTQHEIDEQSEIVTNVLGTNPLAMPDDDGVNTSQPGGVNPSTPSAPEGGENSGSTSTNRNEKPVSEHSYVNVS